jgi:hypothetical protein
MEIFPRAYQIGHVGLRAMLNLMEKNNLLVLGNVTQFLVIFSLHGLNYLSYSDENMGMRTDTQENTQISSLGALSL